MTSTIINAILFYLKNKNIHKNYSVVINNLFD